MLPGKSGVGPEVAPGPQQSTQSRPPSPVFGSCYLKSPKSTIAYRDAAMRADQLGHEQGRRDAEQKRSEKRAPCKRQFARNSKPSIHRVYDLSLTRGEGHALAPSRGDAFRNALVVLNNVCHDCGLITRFKVESARSLLSPNLLFGSPEGKEHQYQDNDPRQYTQSN